MKGSVTSIADKTLSFHRFMIFLFHWNVLHCYLKVCFLLFQHSKLTVLQAKMGFFMFQYKTSNNGLSSDHGILGFSLCYVKLHTSLPLHQLTLRDGGEGRTKNLLWQQAEDRFIHKYHFSIYLQQNFMLLKFLHARFRLILSRRVNSSVESYFRSSEILPGKLKFG